MNILKGDLFINMLVSASNNLENKKEEINRLNVFPVPDGDTGTNMSLTFSKATKEICDMQGSSVSEIWSKLSSASLRGARGNSGVILSQFIRGIAKGFNEKEEVDIETLALSFKSGTESAYRAVMKPTEGTILTVMRGLSDEAMAIYAECETVSEFFNKVIENGNKVLSETPELLPKLKQAGVVDSGGMGLMVILEGMKYYLDNNDIPSRILIDIEVEEYKATEEWLCSKAGHSVTLLHPKQRDGKKLIDMCLSNAAQNLSERTKRDTKEMAILNELASVLGLKSPPKYIEAYDISNTAGENNVAGMVVFKDAKPYKKAYKRFKIKTFLGQDDYRSMAEVLDRRFSEYEKGEDETFKVLPDLILLDGAKGQISAVLPVLEKHNINIPVFGMVKDSKHRTRAIATTGGDIDIKPTRKVFTFITNIQDEVHRFAISYQRKLQSKKLLNRELTQIKGIGEKKANALLKHFKSLSRIKNATEQELMSVNGISEDNAKSIRSYFGDFLN